MTYLRLSGVVESDIDAVEAWLAAGDVGPVVIATSGSSGTPKDVVLSREAVLASARASAARLAGSGPWLLALPSSYVAGLNVIVRSLVAGFRPEVLGDWPLSRHAGHGGGFGFISVVPTQLHRWLAEPGEAKALAGFHTVLVGGGPVDPSLRARAAEAGVNLVATYGMAETCGAETSRRTRWLCRSIPAREVC